MLTSAVKRGPQPLLPTQNGIVTESETTSMAARHCCQLLPSNLGHHFGFGSMRKSTDDRQLFCVHIVPSVPFSLL